MRVHFFGATETVTGSKYLIETEKQKILLDCGIFQGPKELRLRNWDEPPFDPAALDAVLLTHAHIDHIGYLPRIVRLGFRGPIFATEATIELAKLLLIDSAELQEEEARYADEVHSSTHNPPLPLYTVGDARRALELLQPFPRGVHTGGAPVLPGIVVSSAKAGHILGSVALSVEAEGRRVTFSGDIGRYDAPLLPDPQPIELGDLFVCESTYGDRDHPQIDPKELFLQEIKTAIARRGPIIIPAFAVGRTQTLLYYLHELEMEGRIPPLPVYIDSPMAVDSTEIYRRHRYDFDDDAQAILREKRNPLSTLRTQLVRSVQESKALNHLDGSRIIISASGMATGGRVLHHLMRWLPVESATVLFVGYQGEGTRGGRLLAGEPTVKIFGREVSVRAAIRNTPGLSAHADRSELLRWIKSCSGSPRSVRITHGEIHAGRAFSELLRDKLGFQAMPAKYRDVLDV